MDIERKDRQRKIRRIRLAQIISAIAVAVIGSAVAFQKQVPYVDGEDLSFSTVSEGQFGRHVQASGVLVPEATWTVVSDRQGRVQKILSSPGSQVEETDVLLELSNPDLEEQLQLATIDVARARSEHAVLIAQLGRDVQQAAADSRRAAVRAQQQTLKVNALQTLFGKGAVSDIELDSARLELELLIQEEREARAWSEAVMDLQQARLAAKDSEILSLEKRRNAAARYVHSLSIPAGLSGTLDSLSVAEGEIVAENTAVATVSSTDEFKAVVRVSQSQAQYVRAGQETSVDILGQQVRGTVASVGSAVTGGAIDVEVTLVGDLPHGTRSDLSVSAKVEVSPQSQRVFVERPQGVQENEREAVFVLDGDALHRREVDFGYASGGRIEIVAGLRPGDRIVASSRKALMDVETLEVHR